VAVLAADIREGSMRKKKAKKGIISTIVLVAVLLVGLSVMLYPTVSNWWNVRHQTRAIAAYQKKVTDIDEAEYDKILERAHEYNEKLAALSNPLKNYDEIEGYDDILDITGTGAMGYITIPQISVELPIYHGTSAEVLNAAVGHLQGSSLPVGGESTHAVISAHRGLPSAKLFTDLDKLVEGDRFTITVLNETLTYEVDQILIVKPDETESLNIVPGMDYVTLTTCTPYGINTHRLLVRGHRVENPDEVEAQRVSADAVQIDSMLVVPFIAAPLVLIMLAYWIFGGKKRKKIPDDDPLSVFESGEDEKIPPDSDVGSSTKEE
jgi:sortase A